MLEGAKLIGAGAATIALAGAAAGIGNALSSLIHSVARNPSLAKQLSGHAISGFALTEAIALSASMMAFLISFVPLPLAPFLVLLELIPHCFRASSLGIRLSANMMAGHSSVKIPSGFARTMPYMNNIMYSIWLGSLFIFLRGGFKNPFLCTNPQGAWEFPPLGGHWRR